MIRQLAKVLGRGLYVGVNDVQLIKLYWSYESSQGWLELVLHSEQRTQVQPPKETKAQLELSGVEDNGGCLILNLSISPPKISINPIRRADKTTHDPPPQQCEKTESIIMLKWPIENSKFH